MLSSTADRSLPGCARFALVRGGRVRGSDYHSTTHASGGSRKGILLGIEMTSKSFCSNQADQVNVTVDGQLVARLQPNVRPGWSKLAARNGPLALPLD
jgi:hypothetical protein